MPTVPSALGSQADDRQIDVDDKGSLDKATVIAALGQSGDADYDSVCLSLPHHRVFGQYTSLSSVAYTKSIRE
jgi:hypothetical protein